MLIIKYQIIIFLIIFSILMYRGRISQHEKNLDQTRMTNATQNRNAENQDDTLQKQIESYTRKFQQEKRKLFRAQQNHRQILKDYQNQVSDLEKLKSNKYQTQITGLNSKIKYLEINLEKGITAYNDALSRNNMLKSEIDQLRKDKKNQKQAYKSLTQKIEELNSSIATMDQNISSKKSKVQKTKQQILEVRQKNEQENNQHINDIEQLKKSSCFASSIREMKNGQKQTQTSDTQPIVKLRIRNLMHLNKEKIKIAEMYKKSMEKIWQSFQEIKEESGIHDLEEITKTFLKQEEQNTVIFQYINKLSTQLELIRQQNQSIAKKIQRQEQLISQHRNQMGGTPQQQKQKTRIQNFYKQKQKHIQKLSKFLQKIQPELLPILKIQFSPNQQILSYSNIETHLSALQQLINQKVEVVPLSCPTLNQKPSTAQSSQQFTKYTKVMPVITVEQLREREREKEKDKEKQKQKQKEKEKQKDKEKDREEGMMEQSRLREYAGQFWDRRKCGK